MTEASTFDPGAVALRSATADDIEMLEAFVRDYHAFEHIASDARHRRRAIMTLVENPNLGQLWLIDHAAVAVGYIALCFGYSLEFAGRDAFIDEFFIVEAYRGRGLGRIVLERVAVAARGEAVRALHLEVARDNAPAARLYGGVGFVARDKYQLMTLDLSS